MSDKEAPVDVGTVDEQEPIEIIEGDPTEALTPPDTWVFGLHNLEYKDDPEVEVE